MRIALVLVAGIAIGWFARDLTFDKSDAERAPRRTADRDAERDRVQNDLSDPALRKRADLPAGEQPDDAGSPAAADPLAKTDEPGAEGGTVPAEKDPIEEWLESVGPQWKGWATMQVRQRMRGIFAELGFDEETQKRIEEALIEEAERQTERALLMMLGEAELDVAAFEYFMGVPSKLSTELEHELGTFLDDGEMAKVRGRIGEAHEQQKTDMADMQIAMMGVKDLSEDQTTRLRDVFKGKDLWGEQMTSFAEVTRDRDLLNRIVEGGGNEIRPYMKESMAELRRRVGDILTPEQFKGYEVYEESVIKQAEMGMKMMAGMLKSAPTREKK